MFIGHESHAHRSVLKPMTDQRRPKDFITKGKAEEAPTLAFEVRKGCGSAARHPEKSEAEC